MMSLGSPLRLNHPWVRYGAIALVVIILLTLLLAPNTVRGVGSTYSRAPDGYGAWYAYMQERGTPIQRWRLPFNQLSAHSEGAATLVRVISPPLPVPLSVSDREREWVAAGNRLILVGIAAEVTAAPFTSTLESEVGAVKVDTRRRLPVEPTTTPILADANGAIALRTVVGQGELIFITPYYLAANAYQDEPGNFAFLAQVVGQEGHTLYVDEFIHGYSDSEDAGSSATASEQTVLSYLSNTPLLLLAVQGVLVLALLIGAENQRFGQAIAPQPTRPNNSRAYIHALATVLRKAESREFVVEVVGKQEQLAIQKALGLGSVPLEPVALVQVWSQQTGRPPGELEQVLRPYWQHQRLSEADLITWIARLQAIHTHLPEGRSLR